LLQLAIANLKLQFISALQSPKHCREKCRISKSPVFFTRRQFRRADLPYNFFLMEIE